MLNLIKADLFRLRKSKTFKISFTIMMLIIIGFSFLYFLEEDFLMINTVLKDNRIYGFSIGKVRENIDYINFFRSSLGFTIFICLIMFFVVVDSVISKYSNGTLKNTLAYGHNRYKVYISIIISTVVGVSIIAVTSIILSMSILCILFTPQNKISQIELITIVKVTITWLIVLAAMTSFYTLMATIIRSKAVITTIGALFISLGSVFLFDMLNWTTKGRIPIFMLYDICGNPSNSKLLNIFAFNSIAIILITTIAGCIIFNKQEIK
ncbi:MAG: ABC transporter permease subunit [Clostridium sp.]|uniref:ABC transporter permease subunit n=1 Tax=Clostridium sp. TaxID=1506 RepID=UPI003F2AB138